MNDNKIASPFDFILFDLLTLSAERGLFWNRIFHANFLCGRNRNCFCRFLLRKAQWRYARAAKMKVRKNERTHGRVNKSSCYFPYSEFIFSIRYTTKEKPISNNATMKYDYENELSFTCVRWRLMWSHTRKLEVLKVKRRSIFPNEAITHCNCF